MDLAALDAPPALDADGIVLEPLRVDHAPEMTAVLDDTRLHRWVGGGPATVEQLHARYARQVRGRSADGRQAWLNWVVRSTDGAALGYVQATVEAGDGTATAHVAWVVGIPHQGAGAATRAAASMVGWLRSCGVERFVADVHPGNVPSRAVARALGMRESGEVVDGEDRWSTAEPFFTPVRPGGVDRPDGGVDVLAAVEEGRAGRVAAYEKTKDRDRHR